MGSDNIRHFDLGDAYPGVRFTRREVDCLQFLLEGKTIADTAVELGLSPRTVEYYVKNMRLKISARSKYDLLKSIREATPLPDLLQSRMSVAEQ